MSRRIRDKTRIVVPRNRMAEAMYNNKKMGGHSVSATAAKDRIERKHDDDWKQEVDDYESNYDQFGDFTHYG